MNFEGQTRETPKNPLEYKAKMGFQMYLMKRGLGEDPEQDAVLKWIEENAKAISDILDDDRNAEIRGLILQNNFEKAAELFPGIGKSGQKAA